MTLLGNLVHINVQHGFCYFYSNVHLILQFLLCAFWF